MKLKIVSLRRRNTAASFAALLATAVIPWTSLLANTELDVPTTASTLNDVPGIGASSDVTFIDSPYTNTTLTTTSLTIGTLDNLNTTQALTITNDPSGDAVLSLNGGSNSVPGASGGDTLFVASGANLSLTNSGAFTLNLQLLNNSTFDVVGTANIGASIVGTRNLNKTGSGVLTLSQANTYSGGTQISSGILRLTGAGTLGSTTAEVDIYGGATLDLGGTSQTVGNFQMAAYPSASVINGNLTASSYNFVTFAGGGVVSANLAGTSPSTSLQFGGNSELAFSGANTYAGGTILQSGGKFDINSSVVSATASAVGTGTITFNSGNIDNTSGAPVVLGTNNTQIWNTNINFGGPYNASNSLDLGTGAVSLGTTPGPTRTVYTYSSVLIVGGVISDGTDANTPANSLFKDGPGALTLGGANVFTGGVTLNAGTLNINNGGTAAGSSLGTGAFVISGNSTLGNTSGAAVTLATNNAQTWNADFSFAGPNALNLGTGAVSLGTSAGTTRTITVNSSVLTVGGAISDGTNANTATNSLAKSGFGTLLLTGANTYSGSTTVNAGTLALSGAGTLGAGGGALTLNGGTLDLGGTSQTTGAVTINGPSTGTTAGPISFNGDTLRNGSLTATSYAVNDMDTTGITAISANLGGTGALTLTNSNASVVSLTGNNTYSGGTSLGTASVHTPGILDIGSNTALGTGRLTIHGGTLRNSSGMAVTLTNNNSESWNDDFSYTGNTLNLGTGNVTLGGLTSVTVNSGILVVGGTIGGNSGFTKGGAGQLTLGGANTFTGGLTLNAGTLNLNNGGTAAGSALGTGTLTIAGGTIDNTSGAPVTVATNNPQVWNADFVLGGTNNLNLGTGAITMNGNRSVSVGANTVVEGGVISEATSGLSLTKNGFGTLALAGQNQYTGQTTINNGTLLLDFADSAVTSQILNAANASSTVTLVNGTLAVLGKDGVDTTQTILGDTNSGRPGTVALTTNQGNSAIMVTPGAVAGSTTSLVLGNLFTSEGSQLRIGSASANAGTANITFGSISRNYGQPAGGFIDFTLPTNGTIRTTQQNQAGSILGSYATVGGTTWAVSAGDGTTPGAVTGLSTYTNNTWADGNNVDVTSSNTQMPDSTTNSVRFNTAAPVTVTLSGTIDSVESGGILETANVGANNVTITGGHLRPLFTRELAITQNNTAGTLTIDSIIGDLAIYGNVYGGSTLTKAGPGTVVLTNTNTYSGRTYLFGGTLNIASDASLGTGDYFVAEQSATLQLASNAGVTEGSRNYYIQQELNGNTFTLDTNGSGNGLIIDGSVQGPGSLAITGGGSVTLAGNNNFGGPNQTITSISSRLNINTNSALGEQRTNIVIAGGSIDSTGSGAVTISNYNGMVLDGDITFRGTHTLALNTGSVIFGGNLTLTLNSDLRSLTLGGAITGEPATLTGNGSLTLAGAGTLNTGIVANPGGLVLNNTGGLNIATGIGFAYQGVISGTGPLAYSGTSTLFLQGVNTYSGPTTISSGTVSVASLASGGMNGGLGSGTVINLGGDTATGTLQYAGSAGSVVSRGETSDRTINLVGAAGNGGTVDASGYGRLALTGNVSATAAGAKTFTLTGSNFQQNNESGVISDGSDVVSLTKSGTGTWVVSGNNTFSGGVSIAGGTLTVDSLNSVTTSPSRGTTHSASSALGAPTTTVNGVIALGATSSAILRYTGPGETTDRSLFLAGSSTGATIDASGSGALVFTSSFQTPSAGSKTLTLTGTNTGGNTLSGNISGSGIGMVKTGPGNWTLTGSGSTYSGGTAINQGTLTVADTFDNGTQTSLGSGGVNANLGGALRFVGSDDGDSTLNINSTLTLAGGNITILPGAGTTATITAASYARTAGVGTNFGGNTSVSGPMPSVVAGITTISGPNLGQVADNGLQTAQVTFGTAPAVSGLNTTSATVLAGVLGADLTSNAKGFVTYDAGVGGVRLLNGNEQSTTYDGATNATNVRLDLIGSTTIAGTTTQTLQLNNVNGTGTRYTVTNSSNSLNPTNGLLFSGDSPITLTGGTLQTAGGGEAIIISTATAPVTISTPIQTNGGNVSVGGTGNILLTTAPNAGGNGFLVYNGTGTLTLPGVQEANNFQGGLEVVSGTAKIGSAFNTPNLSANLDIGNISVGGGGTVDLNYSGASATNFGIATSGASVDSTLGISGANGTFGTITNSGAGVVGLNVRNYFATDNAPRITGNIEMLSGTNGNQVTLFNANTYTGGTYFGSGGFVINSEGTSAGSAGSLGVVPASFKADNLYFNGFGRLIASNNVTLSSNRGLTIVANSYADLVATAGSRLVVPGVISGPGNVYAGDEYNFLPANPLLTDSANTGGIVALTGANTYTGMTILSKGTLSFNSIGMVGGTTPNALGEPATLAAATINLGNGTSGDGVVLQYTGPTVTTDRPLNANADARYSTGIGPTIDASGSGPITFTGGIVTSYALGKSVVLTGLNTGMNTIRGGISDYSLAAPTSLIKTGVGTWVIGSATTYTGSTLVGGGTMYAAASGAMASTSTISIANGGTLLLSGAAAGNDRINNAAPISIGQVYAAGTNYFGGGTFGRGGTANVLEGTGAHVSTGVFSGTNTPGMGALTLTANANLDFGSIASSPGVSSNGVATFVFSGYAPNGKVLNILNYVSNSYYPYGISGTDGADDRLIFASDQLANLSDFTFGAGGGAQEISLGGGYYEIVPALSQVPEPGTWLAGALSVLALAWSQRRRVRSLFGRMARI